MLRTATLVLALGLTGCATTGGDEVDAEEARAALEQQRVDVREATSAMLRATEARLPGAVRNASGSWRGCQAGGLEEYRNFQYLAQARVDAGPDATRPYLDALRPVLEQAGFTVGEPQPGPGGGSARNLPGTRGDLEAAISEIPDVGDYVLLTVSGACVDVAEEERDDWLVKDDPTPIE